MSWIYWLLLAAGVAILVLYFAFPEKLVASIIRLGRKWAGLSAKSVIVDGVPWPYLEGGPANAETVVMVHGFGGDKDNWLLYAHCFTGRHRVIAPDLPGFGENVRNPDWDYGVAAQTARLHAFCTELGLQQMHLTGNSMGGYIALDYALTHGRELRSLTLIDNAGVTATNKSELELAIDDGDNPLVAASIDDFDRLLQFIMHKQIPTPKILKKAMFEIHRRHFDFLDGIFWTIVKSAREHSLTDRLGDVAMPTLIIWGRHDRLIDISCADVMADAIPDNEVVIIEDAGHIPMIECPAESARHQIALIAGG